MHFIVCPHKVLRVVTKDKKAYRIFSMLLPEIDLVLLIDPKRDLGAGSKRWNLWRPSIVPFKHLDIILIRRAYLLHKPAHGGLAAIIEADILHLQPHMEIRRLKLENSSKMKLDFFLHSLNSSSSESEKARDLPLFALALEHAEQDHQDFRSWAQQGHTNGLLILSQPNENELPLNP